MSPRRAALLREAARGRAIAAGKARAALLRAVQAACAGWQADGRSLAQRALQARADAATPTPAADP